LFGETEVKERLNSDERFESLDGSSKISYSTDEITEVLLEGARAARDAWKPSSGTLDIHKLKIILSAPHGIQCGHFTERQKNIAHWFCELADESIKRRLLEEAITQSVL
jgi:hypothetical protein